MRTCPTTPTGRSGSRPTGSPRCASRSGSGSTRSSSCRSCSSAARRSGACSATRRCSTSTGREMHGSWGNMIDAEDAFERMGADVMRWQYCAQPPDRNLLFGFGPAHEIKRKLLTFWNSAVVPRHVREHRGLRADARRPRERPAGASARSTAGSSRARSARRARRDGVRGDATVDVDPRIRGVRRRPLELVHPPLAPAFLGDDDAAFRTLWYALVQSLRVIAPVMPFLDRPPVAEPRPGVSAASVHLAGWPEVPEPDDELLDEIAEVRRVVELGRQARSTSGLKLRQPLRRIVVAGATARRGPRRRDRRRAARQGGRVRRGRGLRAAREAEPARARARSSARSCARCGPRSRRAVQELDGGRFRVDGHVLEPDEVLVERTGREGWAVASDGRSHGRPRHGLDDELRLEARVND